MNILHAMNVPASVNRSAAPMKSGLVLALLAAMVLSACGGGRGSAPATAFSTSSTPTVPVDPPTSTSPDSGSGTTDDGGSPGAGGPTSSPCDPLSAAAPLRASLRVIAGNPDAAGDSDGVGGAARFNQPGVLTKDADGNLYVSDDGNGKIRKVCPRGHVSTVANVASLSPFAVKGLAVDAEGKLHFSNATGAYKLISSTQIAPVGSGIDSLGRLAFDSRGVLFTFENKYLSQIPDGSVPQAPAGLRKIEAGQTSHVWDYGMNLPQGSNNNEEGFTDMALDETRKQIYIASDLFNVVAKLSYEMAYEGTSADVPGIRLPGEDRIQRIAADTQGDVYAFTNMLGKVYRILPDDSVVAVAGAGTPVSMPLMTQIRIRSIVGTGHRTFAFTANHAVYELRLP